MHNSRHHAAQAVGSIGLAGVLVAVADHPILLVPIALLAGAVVLIAVNAAFARNRARRRAAYDVLRLILRTFTQRSDAGKDA